MASLEERARAAEDDLKAALLDVYPRLMLIVFVALNLVVVLFYVAQTNFYASGAAYMRLKFMSHLTVAFESISSRRVISGFAATVPPPP